MELLKNIFIADENRSDRSGKSIDDYLIILLIVLLVAEDQMDTMLLLCLIFLLMDLDLDVLFDKIWKQPNAHKKGWLSWKNLYSLS